jgi:hypothetical protein
MDDTNIVTKNFEFTCIECQNINPVDQDKSEDEVIECQFCGIEYEIAEVTTDGEYILQLLEEEK